MRLAPTTQGEVSGVGFRMPGCVICVHAYFIVLLIFYLYVLDAIGQILAFKNPCGLNGPSQPHLGKRWLLPQQTNQTASQSLGSDKISCASSGRSFSNKSLPAGLAFMVFRTSDRVWKEGAHALC